MVQMFCKKCGSLLVPAIENNKKVWKCLKCGIIYEGNSLIIGEERINVRKEEISLHSGEDEYKNWPTTTDVECPKCGNKSAYYTVIQTRAADEAPTIIYVCTKCKHKWREYG